MRVRQQVFMHDRVLLDGSEFDQCTFVKCVIVYRGEQETALRDNRFEDCEFRLEGSARLTMGFLKGMADSSDGFLITFLKSLALTPSRLERLAASDAPAAMAH